MLLFALWGGTPATAAPILYDDTTLNPHPNGLSFPNVPGLDLTVLSGIEILRIPGWNANGVDVHGSGSDPLRVVVSPGVTIAVEGEVADGVQVHATGNSSIEIVSGADISIVMPAGSAGGGAALLGWISNGLSPGSIRIVQNAGSVHRAQGYNGLGIHVSNEGLGSAYIEVAGDTFTVGDLGYGVIASNANSASTSALEIELSATGRIFTDGSGSIGIFATHYGLGHVAITLSGHLETAQSSDGVLAMITNAASAADVTIDINSTGTVWVQGELSYAVWAVNNGGGQGRITNHGHVLASGSQSTGLVAQTVAEAIVTNAGDVTASGEYGIGILSRSATAVSKVDITAGATVMGGWQSDVSSVGPDTNRPAGGVMLRSIGSVLTNAGTIGAGSDRAIADTGRWQGALGALQITNSGTVTGFVEFAEVPDNSFINAASGLFNVRHFADSDGDGIRDIKRVAISDFGDPDSSFDNVAGASVRLASVQRNIATDAAGYYVPTTGAGSVSLEAGFYNLTRSGIVQGQFTQLGIFRNAGDIDLRGTAIGNTLVITANATAGGVPGDGLFVSDGGRLILNTVFNEGVAVGGGSGSQSDVLIVDGTALGSAPTTIIVDRREGTGAQTSGNGILLVEVRNKSASAADVFTLQGDYVVNGEPRIVGGMYIYTLHQHGIGADAADGNWYLRSVGFSPTVPLYQEYVKVLVPLVDMPTRLQRVGTRHWNEPESPATWQTGFDRDVSPNAITEGQVNYDVDRDGSVVLEANGIWGRIEGSHGHYEARSSTVDAEYDLNTWRLRVGIDRSVYEDDHRKLIAGISAHYGQVRGDVSSTLGSGNIDAQGYGIGGSLTWYELSGLYVDAQAQATWLRSDIRSSMLANTLVDGNEGFGYATGIEVGCELSVDEKWSMIPQAQLIYTRIDFDDFTDSFDARVALQDGDSLRVRVGLAGEYETRWLATNGTVSRASLYGIANLHHELLDGFQVSVSGGKLTSRNERLWAELGLGGSFNWNDDRYSIYGEVSARTGLEDFGDSYLVTAILGLRVTW